MIVILLIVIDKCIISIGTTIESVEIQAASKDTLLVKLPTKYNYSTFIQFQLFFRFFRFRYVDIIIVTIFFISIESLHFDKIGYSNEKYRKFLEF